jgi:transposase
MANKKYPQEFRDSTVQLALNSDKSVAQIGEDLGVNSKTIHNWIREYKLANNIKIDARRTTQKSTLKETVDDENIRLRAENKILKQERDILKKATAYFAREVL